MPGPIECLQRTPGASPSHRKPHVERDIKSETNANHHSKANYVSSQDSEEVLVHGFSKAQLDKWTQSRGNKGRSSLNSYRKPKLKKEPPGCLYHEEKIVFEASDIQLVDEVTNLLGLSHADDLNSFMLTTDDLDDRSFPKQAHNLVRNHDAFSAEYLKLIEKVIAPHMRKVCGFDESEEFVLMYQFPPTLRCHCSVYPPKAIGRCHNDNQYGHQNGEINFWLPLCSSTNPSNTVWRESDSVSVHEVRV